jgi:hypothetical protein
MSKRVREGEADLVDRSVDERETATVAAEEEPATTEEEPVVAEEKKTRTRKPRTAKPKTDTDKNWILLFESGKFKFFSDEEEMRKFCVRCPPAKLQNLKAGKLTFVEVKTAINWTPGE